MFTVILTTQCDLWPQPVYYVEITYMYFLWVISYLMMLDITVFNLQFIIIVALVERKWNWKNISKK